MITAASRTADASKREVQRLAAMGRSMAKAAFIQSSQRNGSCTKRNLGKCCHSKLLRESIRTALTAPQVESSIRGRATPVALRATGQPWATVPTCLVWRENQIEKTRTPISVSAIVETSRLKRL